MLPSLSLCCIPSNLKRIIFENNENVTSLGFAYIFLSALTIQESWFNLSWIFLSGPGSDEKEYFLFSSILAILSFSSANKLLVTFYVNIRTWGDESYCKCESVLGQIQMCESAFSIKCFNECSSFIAQWSTKQFTAKPRIICWWYASIFDC